MLPEYDFSGKKGQRGKYHQAYERGHAVRVIQEDGSAKVQYFTLEDGASPAGAGRAQVFSEFGER